jgi:ribosomal protein S18 acetylase RimI-like enzyme
VAGSISVDVAPLDLLQQTLPPLLSNLSIARAQIAIDQIRATIDTRALDRVTFLRASPDDLPSSRSTKVPTARAENELSAAAIAIQQSSVAELDKTEPSFLSASSDMATMIHAGFLGATEAIDCANSDSGDSKQHTDSIRQDLILAVAAELEHRLRSQGVDFVQWATDPKPQLDNTLERWCLGLGFEAIGSLDYLSCDLQSDPTDQQDRQKESIGRDVEANKDDNRDLRFTPIDWSSPNAIDRFADLVERTYDATLDCPGLSRFRTPLQILQGYRSSSAFDPASWFHIKDRTDHDIGCLVMASHRDTHSSVPDPTNTVSELVYMALVPEARGRGLGQHLVHYAIERTREQGRKRVILAVDKANTPARSVYDQVGFRKMLSETVWVKRLNSAKRENPAVA